MSAPGFDWNEKDFRRQLKKSSFAPGAMLLEAPAQRDLEVFYAFCRAVDDSADDFGPQKGRLYLSAWSEALAKKPSASSPILVRELWRISQERQIPMELMRELIKGAESDLRPQVTFKTRKELFLYCHRVAGVVGQACLPIFGISLKQGAEYAETLGRAFQLINIIRDAKEDAWRKRDYFAQDDLKRFRTREAVIAHYAGLAQEALYVADRLSASLPPKGLRPSRMMRALYGELLDRMFADNFRVFEKRYRLSAFRKAWVILKSLIS